MHRLILVVALVVISVRTGVAQNLAGKGEQLVPARYQALMDGQGRQWSVQQDGTVDSSNSFGSSGRLLIGGNSFTPSQQPMMTADGREYVHTGTINGLQIVRRVKVDLTDSTVRFIDVL